MRQLVGSRGRGVVLAFTLLVTGLTVAVQAPSAGPVAAEPVFLASYRERVLANNPVGYWGLNEQSGRRAIDSGPNRIEADYRGPAGSFTLGEEPAVGTGSSVRLDGVDGFVYVADSWTPEAELLAPREELSVELWFKPEALSLDGQNHILARWRWYGWQLRVFNNRVYGDLWEQTTSGGLEYTSVIGDPLVVHEWVHVVMTKDSSRIRLFMNGVEVGSQPSKGDAYYEAIDAAVDCCGTGGGVGFGRDADVDVWYFKGWLDEIAVYGSALDPADVATHHDVGTLDVPAEIAAGYGDSPGAIHASDPVHTGTGSLWLEATDLASGAVAPVAGLMRSYNSRDDRVGVLGRGWTTSVESRLSRRDGDVLYVAPDGRTTRFIADGAGGWVRPDGVFADLVAVTGGFELRFFDGATHRFDSAGWLLSATDWTGESMTITRDSDGLATSMSWSTGQEFTLGYDTNDRIVSVIAGDGREVVYGYTDGFLTSVTDPTGATVVYSWTPTGFLESMLDAAGVEEAFNVYDESGRVVEQRSQQGDATFVYDDTTSTTIVTNIETGEQVVYTHDSDGRATAITDPDGNAVTIQLNADGLSTGTTNRLGHNPAASYDANGNLTSTVDPVRGTTSYTYDTDNRVTSVTEPTGAVTTMTYEGTERLPSTVTDALGAVTTFDVIDGLVVSVADSDGVITGYGYDAERRMDAMTNGLGNAWTYTFDAVGRQTSATTPLGHVTSRTFDDAGRILTSIAADGGVTTYTYDADGRVLTVTDPTGADTANTYDPITGLLTTTTDPAGRVTTYTYNATAELIAVTANDGAVSETDYGTLGRVTATRDPLGRESTYAYDANGNRTEVVAPDGGVTRTEYDTAGRITALEDPLGRRTINTYDDYGRLISVTRPDGTVMSYTYDLLGRQTEVTAPDDGTTTTTFTPAGRTATVTDPEGGVTSYGYDDAGQTVTVTDPNGHVTSFEYDADGRRTAVITPEGLVTTTEYDPMGRVTKLIDPAGVDHTRSYTLRGELASERREGDGVISYSYNPDGTMAAVVDALGNTTSFTYDTAGRQATRIDATGATEVWEYNPAGELVAQIDRLGQRTEIDYDASGRIATVADPSGRTTTHTYNPAGELEARTFGDGTTIGYSYDTMGRRVSMSDPTGITTYDYDPNGRPTTVAAPNGTLAYSYDQAGRRTGLTYPDGTTVTYTYDPAGRLTGLTDPNTGDIDYTLDDDGRLELTELPNGQTRQFDYSNGQMIRHQDRGRVTDLTYDNSGRIASLSGAQNHTYTYDQAGQLLQAVQDDGTYSYTYGPRGEITSITDPERSRTFTHNANTEIDSIVDDQGRPGDVTYDQAGRITEHDDPDGTTTTYTYDARGLLVEVTVTQPAESEPEIPYPEPVAGVPTTGTISPIFECWTRESDGTYTAYWGYENRTTQNGEPVGRTIAHGPQNRLTPAAFQGTQPTRFGVPGVVPGRPGRTAPGAAAPNAFVTRGWNGSNLVWNVAGRTATASNTPSKQCTPVPSTQTVTTETRTHNGDSTLTSLTNTQSGRTGTTYSLLWDRTTAVPNIAVLGAATVSSNIVYGATRETLAGGETSFTALGDQTTPSGAIQPMTPYGPPTDPGVDIGFGYRGELNLSGGIHLRARDMSPSLASFVSRDPLPGVPGATDLSSPHVYASSNPIQNRDPLGLRSSDAAFGVGSAAGDDLDIAIQEATGWRNSAGELALPGLVTPALSPAAPSLLPNQRFTTTPGPGGLAAVLAGLALMSQQNPDYSPRNLDWLVGGTDMPLHVKLPDDDCLKNCQLYHHAVIKQNRELEREIVDQIVWSSHLRGYQTSARPAEARARRGPLPPGRRGVEFLTEVPPTGNVDWMGGMFVNWRIGSPGVDSGQDERGEYAEIPIFVVRAIR